MREETFPQWKELLMIASCLCSFGGDTAQMFSIFFLPEVFYHHSNKDDFGTNRILAGPAPQIELQALSCLQFNMSTRHRKKNGSGIGQS